MVTSCTGSFGCCFRFALIVCIMTHSLLLGRLHLAMRQLLSERASNLIQDKRLPGVESVMKSVAGRKMRVTEIGICGNVLLQVWFVWRTGGFACCALN